MVFVILLVQAVAFAILSGIVASNKNRDPFGWGIIGFLFGIFGFIAAIAVGDGETEGERPKARRAKGLSEQSFDPDQHEKKCPACAEYIKLEARVCKHCGHQFSDKQVKKQIESVKKKIENEQNKEASSRGKSSRSEKSDSQGRASRSPAMMLIMVVLVSALILVIVVSIVAG